MHALVLLRMVPDVVEELEIAPSGTTLATESTRMILNESDDQALEQALLLKESRGGTVTVLALEAPEVDEVLFTALAKGADYAIRIAQAHASLSTREAAAIFAQVIEEQPGLLPADLILTGVQTAGDMDVLLAPVLARRLRLPHLGIVSRLYLDYPGRVVTAIREYPGGVRGEFEVPLPAVFGVQAAEKPPRYVPVTRVRTAMREQQIRCVPDPVRKETAAPLFQVLTMRKTPRSGHAEMLQGSHEVVSRKLREILAASGLLGGSPL